MTALQTSLNSRGTLIAALAMSWLFAGWLGAQAVQIDAAGTSMPNEHIQAQSIERNPQAQATIPGSIPGVIAQAPVIPTGTAPVNRVAQISGEENMIPGALPQGAPNQFARPVDEEITEALVAATNLTGEETIMDRIFSERSRIEQLLGNEAIFVYDSDGRRDPMIIPWIRREFDVANLLEQGRRLEREGNLSEAIEAFAIIVNEYGGSRAAGEAAEALARITPQMRTSVAMGQVQVVLPREIAQNLTGIIDDDVRPNCLIGDNIYGEGDVIPNYDVTVLEIRQDAVVFFYRDQEFTVPVAVN
jgi:hypothetical protein